MAVQRTKNPAPQKSQASQPAKGGTDVAALTGLPKDRLLGMLLRMAQIRGFEEHAATLYREGLIRGVTHTSQGQEAVSVGVSWTLRTDDYVTSTHRGHAHVIAKGGELTYCMAELMGKATGYCKGRGGSMHIADMSQGILGANGIVGGGMGIAIGSALASKRLGKDRVTVCYFGDGALNQGILHEVSNMAAIWKLPVVFLCENNLYGMSGPVEEMLSLKGADFKCRADTYGMPSGECDGMDPAAVYVTSKEAVERARRGEGPSYVFCHTYRFLGHHVGDPLTYRDKSEVEPWKKKDPIPNFAARLIKEKVATQQEVDGILAQATADVEAAIAFAEESPEPDPADLMEDVFG